jgi:prepilin-type N-terminal cleavage/methylation domain-containing protein
MRLGGSKAAASFGAGFTLPELVVALVLISVAASLAIPNFFGRADVTLDSAVRLLAKDIREAQNRAAFESRDVRIVFPSDGSGYQVIDPSGEPLVAPIGSGPFVRTYARDAVFRGVSVDAVRLGGDRTITFDNRGFAVGAGLVQLRYGDEVRSLHMSDRTGLIEIQGTAEPYFDDGR